jgi:type II secretory pathway pseudopilin PulG
VIDLLRKIRSRQGFTLIETVIATGFLAMGLVGLLAGIGQGTASVDSARRGTTALFLAEQQMEAARAFALSGDGGRGWPNLTTAAFPAEGYCPPATVPDPDNCLSPPPGCICGYPDYRRTVTVTNLDVAPAPNRLPNTKQVEVRVYYRPVTAGAETSVAVSTLVVDR